MNMIISEIIESVLFFFALIFVINLLQYLSIDFNFFYVVGGLLIVWTTAKIFLNRKKMQQQ